MRPVSARNRLFYRVTPHGSVPLWEKLPRTQAGVWERVWGIFWRRVS